MILFTVFGGGGVKLLATLLTRINVDNVHYSCGKHNEVRACDSC